MNDNGPVNMSQEGFDKMKAELHRLKYTDRPAIVAEIKRAMEMGDLSENAEYHAAKEAQSHLERQIADLEFKLSRARIINLEDVDKSKAYIFAKVTVVEVGDDDDIETFTLVAAEESDPEHDKISIASPIGKGLLGKAVGEVAVIQAPGGTLQLKITDISYDD